MYLISNYLSTVITYFKTRKLKMYLCMYVYSYHIIVSVYNDNEINTCT